MSENNKILIATSYNNFDNTIRKVQIEQVEGSYINYNNLDKEFINNILNNNLIEHSSFYPPVAENDETFEEFCCSLGFNLFLLTGKGHFNILLCSKDENIFNTLYGCETIVVDNLPKNTRVLLYSEDFEIPVYRDINNNFVIVNPDLIKIIQIK